MRKDAHERIHANLEVFAKWIGDRQGVNPELVIRDGEPFPEILAQLPDDPKIGVHGLGSGNDKKGPSPLFTQLA